MCLEVEKTAKVFWVTGCTKSVSDSAINMIATLKKTERKVVMILPQPDEANFAKNKKSARKQFCSINEQ